MRRLLPLLLACISCVQGEAVAWPEDHRLAWLCFAKSEALVGCQQVLPDAPTVLSTDPDTRSFLISLDEQAARTIEPRADLTAIDRFELRPPSDGSFASELCKRYGELERDGRISHPFAKLEGHAGVYELDVDAGRFEAVPFADLPEDLRRRAILVPVRPCMESLELDVQPFGSAFSLATLIGKDDPSFPIVLDEDHVLVAAYARITLFERGRSEANWSFSLGETGLIDLLPPNLPSDVPSAPYRWSIQDLAVVEGPGLSRRGLAAVGESREQFGGPEEFARSALVQFEITASDVRAVRIMVMTEPHQLGTKGRSFRKIEISPQDGSYVAVGYELSATSTSIDVPPTVHVLDDVSAERIVLTGDPAIPHVISDLNGIVYEGDVRKGSQGLARREPFGGLFAALGLLVRTDELGQRWIHASSEGGDSARWRLGDDELETIPLWTPDENQSCARTGELECGRSAIQPQVRSLGTFDASSDVYQVFSADMCTGVFASSLTEGCTVGAPRTEDPIRFEQLLRDHIAVRSGDGWLFMSGDRRLPGTRANLAEVHLEVRP